ncbi:WbqC family protein [Colwelliaceae bacterium 6441]
MKLAVMQPYLFPYLGYYQLVNCSDVFVAYDDVTFIKGGYINRNNILVNGEQSRFTIPVLGASSNVLIKELNFDKNVKKVIKTIVQAYSKAPYFSEVFPILEKILLQDDRNVASMCKSSIVDVFHYLKKDKEYQTSSLIDYNRELSAENRLMALSHKLNCDEYVNSIGGRELYKKEHFANDGIKLSFIQMKKIEYHQPQNPFVANLSMVDVLMWCSKSEIRKLLNEYELI